jgi:DNA polymerase III gamma/tau subunit
LDELLPPAHDERIFTLLKHAAAGDAPAVLTDLDGIVGEGRGLEIFCQDAVEIVRTLLLVRTCGADASLVDLAAGTRDEYVALSQQFELSHYVQMIAMLEELRRNVRYSGAGRALAEAALVRIARLKQWSSIEQLLAQLPGGESLVAGSAEAEKKKYSPIAATPVVPGPAATPPMAVAPPAGSGRAPSRPTNASGLPPVTPSKPSGTEQLQQSESFVLPDRGSETRATDHRSETGATEPEGPSDAPPVTEPDFEPAAEYDSAEAAPALPAGVVAWKEASAAERALIQQDPVVRRVLDLFDGSLLEAKVRVTPRAADAPVE